MSKEISEIIAAALIDLNDTMPELVKAITKNKYFVTKIKFREDYGLPVECVTIVDFEKEIMYDAHPFYEHSSYLFNLFCSIPRWYDC